MNTEDKSYTVMFSAHGSKYTPTPEVFNMTLKEAREDVRLWISRADTIGGDAIIVHKNGNIVG